MSDIAIKNINLEIPVVTLLMLNDTTEFKKL